MYASVREKMRNTTKRDLDGYLEFFFVKGHANCVCLDSVIGKPVGRKRIQ